MTYEVQQTRWDRIIRRVSGSIGPGSRVSETISELFPVLDIERVPGELLVLGGVNICNGAASATGAAGQVPQIALANPADSGTLITVTQVAVFHDKAGGIRSVIQQGATGARVNTERFRDGRLISATAVPVGQVRTFASGSLLNQQVEFRVENVESVFFSDENGLAVLSPNSEYVFADNTITATMTVTFWWRERAAEPSELQF